MSREPLVFESAWAWRADQPPAPGVERYLEEAAAQEAYAVARALWRQRFLDRMAADGFTDQGGVLGRSISPASPKPKRRAHP